MTDHRFLPAETAGDADVPARDLYHRLLEAESTGVCPEGDFLALMPSVGRDGAPWVDGPSWMRRLIGL